MLQANAVSCHLHFAVLGFCFGQEVDVFVLGNILIFLFRAKFYCFGLNFNVLVLTLGVLGFISIGVLIQNLKFLSPCLVLNYLKLKFNHQLSVSSFP